MHDESCLCKNSDWYAHGLGLCRIISRLLFAFVLASSVSQVPSFRSNNLNLSLSYRYFVRYDQVHTCQRREQVKQNDGPLVGYFLLP